MKTRQSWLVLIGVFILLDCGPVSAQRKGVVVPAVGDRDGDQPGQDSAKLLQRLRDRDEQFDGMLVEFIKRRSESVDLARVVLRESFNRRRFPGGGEHVSFGLLGKLRDLPPPFPAVYTSMQKVAVRDGIFVIERAETILLFPEGAGGFENEARGLLSVYQPARWSNAGGYVRAAYNREPQSLVISKGARVLAVIDQQRLAVQLALGYGFGTRLLSIDSVSTQAAGNTIVHGTIRMWADDESHCRLLIDHDLVVRESHIHADVRGNQHEFVTQAIGCTDQSVVPVLPTLGSFRKRWLGTMREGELQGKAVDKESFTLQLQTVRKPIPQAEFSRLTRFEDTANTTIHDLSPNTSSSTICRTRTTAAAHKTHDRRFVAIVIFVLSTVSIATAAVSYRHRVLRR